MWLAYSQLFSFCYTWGCVGDFPHVGMWMPFRQGGKVVWAFVVGRWAIFSWGCAGLPDLFVFYDRPRPDGTRLEYVLALRASVRSGVVWGFAGGPVVVG